MLTPQELILTLIIMLPFMLIPTFIGIYRKHPSLGKLIAVNVLLLPIFGIGWIIALIWSVTAPGPDGREP